MGEGDVHVDIDVWSAIVDSKLYLGLFIAGCALVVIVLITVIACCCCRRNRRQGYMPLPTQMNYAPVTQPVLTNLNTLALQVPSERITNASELDLACRYFVHNSRKYTLVRDVPGMGSRPEKVFLLAEDKSTSSPRMLQGIACTKDLTRCKKVIEAFLSSLSHPNVARIFDSEYHQTKKMLITMREFAAQGSINDTCRGIANPLAPAAEKYAVGHAPVDENQIAEWGRHILEGVLYLNNAGLPFVNLSLGNVVIIDGICKLTDYDNLFAAVPPIMRRATGMPDTPEADVVAFALMLYDLAAGRQLRDRNITAADFAPEFPRAVRKVIEAILTPKMGPTPNVSQLLAMPYFSRVTVKYRTNVPPPKPSIELRQAIAYAMSASGEAMFDESM